MFYITADPHGDFRPIKRFARGENLTLDDTIIVLGDAGVNYFGNHRDRECKRIISDISSTVFCIHGNHEMRPESLPHLYHELAWNGGTAFVEDEYPNLLFARDGEAFDFDGTRTLVAGGAYSVDKLYRLTRGWSWFADEQPDDEIKQRVENSLDRLQWRVDAMLTHTCPYKFEPQEAFIQGIDQSSVDKTTEQWLDQIEDRLEYRRWYCGHWHISKRIERVHFMFQEVEPFMGQTLE